MLNARDVVALYNEAKALRVPAEQDFRMAAAYCMPRHMRRWLGEQGNAQSNVAEAGRYLFDTTGVRSVPKYAAVLQRIATPANQRWIRIKASNDDLMRVRAVRVYFQQLTEFLQDRRYDPDANFIQSVNAVYASIGVYGMGPMYAGKASAIPSRRERKMFYKALPMFDMFILTDDEGRKTTAFRRMWLNVRKFKQRFPEAPIPQVMQSEASKATPSETAMFEFAHCVMPTYDYDPNSLSYRSMPFTGTYVGIADQQFVAEPEGFLSNPYLTPRTFTEPGDLYGYSPALQVLGALGTASAIKKTVIKQGHKAVDPPMLAADDGILSGKVDLRPGRVTYGGISRDGRKLVQAMDTGNFHVAETLLQDERNDIQDGFFITLFQMLEENQRMTTTEVVERLAEKAALVAPTLGYLQSELLAPVVEREIHTWTQLGKLPPMPPELVEANGEYSLVYTSPFAKAAYAEEVGAWMRWTEMLSAYDQQRGYPSATDWIAMDEAAPEVAEFMAVRPSWVNDPAQVQKTRDDRTKVQERQQLLDQAPAVASIGKALIDKGMNVKGKA